MCVVYPLDMTFPVGEASIYYYAPFIWSNGGDLISDDGLTADGYFNSDKNAEVFKYFRGLVEKKYMSATPVEKLFESGRAAFKFDGAWEVNTIYQSYSDIDLGVAPYIVSDNWDGGRYTPTGSWAYATTSKTENIDGATELVKWMSGVESGILLYENTKSMADRIVIMKDGVIQQVGKPNDNFISAQLMITSEDGITFDNVSHKKTIIPPIDEKTVGSMTHTRDPKVWRGKDAWYMVIGSTVDSTGRLLFYKSNDLENWSYLNYAEKENFGWMWECPDYFEVDGTGITVFSPMGFFKDGKEYDSAPVCIFSSFDESTGEMELSETYQLFDCGLDLYAPQSTTDKEGNRVIIAWARMPEAVNGEWNGMMCIPRVVEVKNNHIYFRPHLNIKNSFTKEITSPSQADSSGFMVKTSLHNGESINIGGYIIKREQDRIYTDRSAVFAGRDNFRLTAETPVINEGYKLEIYVDSNLIEVFVNNGEYVLSSVVYGLSDEITGADFSLYSTERGAI